MSDNYIKYNRCEKAKWLRKHHLFAYVLLSVIAENSRRTSGHVDGLIPGDAWIGDFKEYGMTRQNYRTALKTLVKLQIVKIVHSGKKLFEHRNLTICLTNKGTLVNLLDTEIWDINKEELNQQANQDLTNSQPTANHKQERIKKEKKEEEVKEKKKKEKAAKAADLEFSEEIKSLVEKMIFSLNGIKPDFKRPRIIRPWYVAMDFLLRLDKRNPGDILDVFNWALSDQFWSDKMFKPNPVKYLREKFDQLQIQMTKKPFRKTPEQTKHRFAYEEYNDAF